MRKTPILIICIIILSGIIIFFEYDDIVQLTRAEPTYEEKCLILWNEGVRYLFNPSGLERFTDTQKAEIMVEVAKFRELQCGEYEKQFYWLPMDHPDRDIINSLIDS